MIAPARSAPCKSPENAATLNRKLYVVTGQRAAITEFINTNSIKVEGILTCDVTSIKTAARVNPTMFLMKGPVVEGKWAGADFEEVGK